MIYDEIKQRGTQCVCEGSSTAMTLLSKKVLQTAGLCTVWWTHDDFHRVF